MRWSGRSRAIRVRGALSARGSRQKGCGMHRFGCLVLIGVVAVAASTVMAGPAGAAKGGDSEKAHACQQGGHENRFEAETGRPFKNAGDCGSHGAQGGVAAALPLETRTDPCPDSDKLCWGVFSASGLSAGALWFVEPLNVTANGSADQNGNVEPTALNVPCGTVGSDLLQAFAQISDNPVTVIASNEVPSPCG